MPTTFRASHALDKIQGNLGLLGDLPGMFIGTGFNLIARPAKQDNKLFFSSLTRRKRSWSSRISVAISRIEDLSNPTLFSTAFATCSA
jgi:hypothetical protein